MPAVLGGNMAERRVGDKKVKCQSCGVSMKIDANALGGFCWECVGNGKYAAFMMARSSQKAVEKRAKVLALDLPPEK